MTEGELLMTPKEPIGHFKEQVPSVPMVPDALDPPNSVQRGHQLHIICSGNKILKDKSTCSYSDSSENIPTDSGDL